MTVFIIRPLLCALLLGLLVLGGACTQVGSSKAEKAAAEPAGVVIDEALLRNLAYDSTNILLDGGTIVQACVDPERREYRLMFGRIGRIGTGSGFVVCSGS